MKSQRWIVLAFVFLVIGIAVSSYLIVHHYDLMYARQEAKSFCNLSATMDCDAVNTSKFSEFFGIPVALIAALTFLTELLLLLGFKALGESEKPRLARFFFYLAFGNVAASIGLAVVSTFILKTYCIMCISMYAVSLLTFISGWMLVDGTKFGLLFSDLASLFKSSENKGARGILILLLFIPAASVLANAMYRESMSGELDKVAASSVADWQMNKQNTFTFGKPHEEGNPSGIFQIVEFSDFQCPHCKRAAPTLHAFINSHKDEVHFVFQNYPLDSSCNSKIKSAVHDKACQMARAALCAAQQGGSPSAQQGGSLSAQQNGSLSARQNKFTEAHDWIFGHQEGLNESSISDMCKDLNLDKTSLEICMQDKSINDELALEIDQGNLAGIEGTPSIYVNGRYLPAGFLIPVLEAALKTIH